MAVPSPTPGFGQRCHPLDKVVGDQGGLGDVREENDRPRKLNPNPIELYDSEAHPLQDRIPHQF